MTTTRAAGRLRRLPFSARIALERLSGKSIFEASHYRESNLTRLVDLFAHVDVEKWRGMKILEVGAGLGALGDAFADLGFEVTSTDGRPEHVEAMKGRGRESFVLDLEKAQASDFDGYDLVLAFGVLYHLAQPEEFLQACGKGAKVLLLETAVCDRAEPVVDWVTEAGGWRGQDQAVSGRGCRPSPSWVERVCHEAGFDAVRDISNPMGDWSSGTFGWEPRNSGEWRRDGVNLRKMWVCERSG
ncbi:MAG TPA: methyltransferase domain-containing protein [Streptosporangiaceae bacterium]|nr:methyltransferase domain-containing protein [Streptosporangiaceae bacterium]